MLLKETLSIIREREVFRDEKHEENISKERGKEGEENFVEEVVVHISHEPQTGRLRFSNSLC